MPKQIDKAPGEDLDYAFDWSDWLPDGDAISSHDLDVETGLTLGAHANTSDEVQLWLSGGTAGNTYYVDCTVVTTGGRTGVRRLEVRVKVR